MCHVYVRVDSLVGICVSDQTYPNQVAHRLLTNVLDKFTEDIPKQQWIHNKEVSGFSGELEKYLKHYQNPEQADSLTKIQTNLEETTIIILDSIQAILERGEKLDVMVEKSQKLSGSSKIFYTTARKTNSCCGSWT